MAEKNFARELRVEIVRKVAAPYFQAMEMEEQITELKKILVTLENEKQNSVQVLERKLVESAARKGSAADAQDFKSNLDAVASGFESRKSELQEIISQKVAIRGKCFNKSIEALQKIVFDVLAEKYGRGELQLSQERLVRVFGRLEELNEQFWSRGLFLSQGNMHNFTIQFECICKTCKGGNPPLIHVDADLMPLDENEIVALCQENEQYFLLRHAFLSLKIPVESIPWKLGCIYLISRDAAEKNETYLVGRGENECVVVKATKGTYPNVVLIALGKLTERDEQFMYYELRMWDGVNSEKDYYNGQDRVPWPVVACNDGETTLALAMLSKYLEKKSPGIICHWPQLEK